MSQVPPLVRPCSLLASVLDISPFQVWIHNLDWPCPIFIANPKLREDIHKWRHVSELSKITRFNDHKGRALEWRHLWIAPKGKNKKVKKNSTCGCGEGCLHLGHSLVAAEMFWWRKWPSPECRWASHSSLRTSQSRVTASTENFKYSDSRNGQTKKSTFTLVNGASWSNGYGCITHGAKGPGMESPWRMKNCLCIFMFCKKIIISKIVPNGANIKKTFTPTIKSVTPNVSTNVSTPRVGQYLFVEQNQKLRKRRHIHK